MTKSLVRYGYVPLMLIGINGAAIGLAHAPWAELWMAALIIAAIGILHGRRADASLYRTSWNTSVGDGRRDVAHAFINETSLLLTVLVIPAVGRPVTLFGERWPASLAVHRASARRGRSSLISGSPLVHLVSHKVGWTVAAFTPCITASNGPTASTA